MGTDKAFVEVRGRPMVLHVVDALVAAGVGGVVVVGGNRSALGALGLLAVADLSPGEGPLGGLVTALGLAGDVSGDQHTDALDQPATDVVVALGCDLPLVQASTVSRLLDAVDDGSVDVAVAHTDRDEPLCAAWRVSTCLPVLQSCLDEGERALHRVLTRLRTRRVPVSAGELLNVNRPEDLLGL